MLDQTYTSIYIGTSVSLIESGWHICINKMNGNKIERIGTKLAPLSVFSNLDPEQQISVSEIWIKIEQSSY